MLFFVCFFYHTVVILDGNYCQLSRCLQNNTNDLLQYNRHFSLGVQTHQRTTLLHQVRIGEFFSFFFLGALPFKHPHFSPRMWRDIMNTQTVLKVTNNRMLLGFFSSLSPNAPKITCVVVTFYILKTFERKHFHMQHFHPFNCRPFDTPSIGIRWNLHKLNSTLRPPVNISKDVHFFISLLAFQSSQRHGRDRTPPQIDSKAPPLTE